MKLEPIDIQCQELAALVNRHTEVKGDGFHSTGINRLTFARESCVNRTLVGVSSPVLAIVVQGKKVALLGEETYRYGASQYLVLSVDLPLTGLVIDATPAKPYLGFTLDVDQTQLCDIIAQTSTNASKKETSVRGFCVSTADVSLLDGALRLTRLLDTPQDIPMLAPMIIRLVGK
jgi:AraC-type transcriptional regulator N-terminus